MNSTPVTEIKFPEYGTNSTTTSVAPTLCRNATCIFFSVTNVIILILGIAGNGLVIWIAGFKVKKSVISTWYLSLAVSDFLFCCLLPFGIVFSVTSNWIFGLFMCKFRYFVMFLNMYSSIFLLVIISMDRCVVVMFPVWARNKRTIRKASVIVVLAWIMSAALSMPMAVFRELLVFQTNTYCYSNFMSKQNRIAVVASRFVLGFLIPFLIIIACYFVIFRKLMSNQTASPKKPFKIMTVLIVTFMICWLPFHIFSFVEMEYRGKFVGFGKIFGVTLASANSILNPFLYAFMGKDFKKQCHALLSKIENALQEEEGHNITQGTAITNSEENKLSANVETVESGQ